MIAGRILLEPEEARDAQANPVTRFKSRRTASRYSIYLRVSTSKQLRGYGLQVQFEESIACLDVKLGKGKYTYEVYTDGGVSGKLAQRPDLSALDADIADGQYGLVIFGKLDRVGRTMKNIHSWVYETTDRNVRVATADALAL
ncbi:recombinase family protein [Streptomyces sp. NPDC087849]|uniref:recombinase family protein n=1 Tax=Streptomyces sp. NPDC087849 TaxID=3365808 RepID=UPI00381DBE1B